MIYFWKKRTLNHGSAALGTLILKKILIKFNDGEF